MATKKQIAVVEIMCNTRQAVEMLNEYKRLATETLQKIEQKTARVNEIKAKGTNATAAEVKEMKQLTKEIKADTAEFNKYNSATQKGIDSHRKLSAVMKDLSGSKLKDLKAALRDLNKMMGDVSNKTPQRARVIQNAINQVQGQINKLQGATKSFGATHSSVWQTAVRNITAYVGVFAAFNKVKSLFTDMIKKNKEFSDQMANVRKVSGLAMNEIAQLANNLSKIDSRTSLQGLMELGYMGSKLGFGNYGIQGLESFVNSAVRVQNALSEDMGPDAMTALSKMVEVMGLIPKMGVEKAMDATGSAIFRLASTSTATGTNIVEFSKRLMGLANIAHISVPDLLAFGSAADSMALAPEVAATAFNKLITAVQKQPNLIENALSIKPGTIDELFRAGQMTEAMVTIFEKMRQKGGMNALMHAGVFKDLGSDGARLVSVMATMANRVDILNTHLATSRQAFADATAVEQEYNIQMETAAAYSERAANLWNKAFVNPEGVDVVKDFTKAWYDMSKQLTESETFMEHAKMAITALITVLKILIQLIPTFTWALFVRGIAAIGIAMNGATLATNGFKAAWMGMSTAMKANWISLAIGGLIQLGVYLASLRSELKDTEDEMKKFSTDLSELNRQYDVAADEVMRYKRAIDQAANGTKEHQAAISNFNNKFGGYLKNLLTEKSTALEVASAYKEVCRQIRNKLALQLREEDIQKTVKPLAQERADLGDVFDQSIKDTKYSQFGRNWLRGYLEDDTRDYLFSAKEAKDAQGVRMATALDVAKKMGLMGGSTGDTLLFKDGKLVTEKGKTFNVALTQQDVKDIVAQVVKGNQFYESGTFKMEGITSGFKWQKPEAYDEKRILFNALKYIQKEEEVRSQTKAVYDKYGDEIDKSIPEEKPEIDKLEDAPDKDAARKAAKARAEAKQRMRKDMKDAEEESTGILSKLEEYYRLQETAINEARADGQLTEDQAKEMVRSLNVFKNESLATARRAIVTGDTTEWDKLKNSILPAVLSDTSEVSRDLLKTIQDVMVDKLHNDLAKFNGSEGVFGLSSRAFFDQIRAKAAGNEREAARLRAKIQNEVEKALLEYQFVEKANKQMRKDVETMGITTETYEQWAKRMQQGIEEKPDTQVTIGENARKEIMEQFKWDWERRYQQPSRTYNGEWNPQSFPFNSDQDEQVQEWFRQFATNAKWAVGIPKIGEWLKDGEKYKAEIRKFYESLILIQESAMQKSESVSPLAPVDETWKAQGEQGLSDLFSTTISDEQAYRQMGNKFIDMGVINFSYNIDNEEEARQWIRQFATDARGDLEAWAQAFPELVEWIDLIKRKEAGETLGEKEQQALEAAMPSIRNLFNEMMRHADRLDKAMKDAFQHEKSLQESRFRIAGYKDQEEQTDKYYSNQAKQQETGAGQNFAQMLGVGSIANDPEILQIQNRIRNRALEVEDARNRLDEMKAMQDERIAKLRETAASEAEIHAAEEQYAQDRAGLEQLLADRQTALAEQTFALTTKTMQEVQKRSQAVLKLSKPFTDAANSIGKKLGDMIRGAEEDSVTWEEIWKNMALAVGESVIEMTAQYMQNLIMQQSINRASEAEEAAHVAAEVPMGIAAGSAKTIGQLGWWGIPLVAVISALLMGLLQAALSTDRSSKSSTTAAKTNVKLKSGMLTYDEGNLGVLAGRRKLYDDGTTQVYDRDRGQKPFVGQDGRVYMATEQPSLPEGVSIVRQPIATTVNGQPALVAERGPEIVIGRKTTRRIMMNEPRLLASLMQIERGRRLYDAGNLGEQVAVAQQQTGQAGQQGDANAERDQQMMQTLAQLTETVAALQGQLAQGIQASVNMYGKGGIDESMRQRDAFRRRYPTG